MEYKGTKVVVSTIGNYAIDEKIEKLGNNYFETMVGFALENNKWDDMDVRNIILQKGLTEHDDVKANEMHESTVDEIIHDLKSGMIKK